MPFFLSVSLPTAVFGVSISHIPQKTGLTKDVLHSCRFSNIPGWQAKAQREKHRGKTQRTRAAQVHATCWAAHHHMCAIQVIKWGPVGYIATSPPGKRQCWHKGSTCTGEEGRSPTRIVKGPRDQVKQLRRTKRGRLRSTDFVRSFPHGTSWYFIICK